MARLFSGLGSNLRSYFGHFGRGFLIIIAVLIIAGLAVTAYLVGDEDRQEANQPATEQQQSEQATQPPSQPGQPSQNQLPSNPSTSPQVTQVPGTGPPALANTGPESIYAVITVLIAVLGYLYRRSSRQLLNAQLL